MWIVRLALKRPYTFIVVSLVILIFGSWFSFNSSKDIFPNIDIPVVSVVWSYEGLTAEDFEERITTYSEFALSSTVNGIERIESQTLTGLGIIRIYFYPDAKIQTAIAQVTATSQQILRRLPPQTYPPVILLYSPSTVPVIQVIISSETRTEEELYDYTTYRLRHFIAVLQGVTLPTPYGGKVRELMVDINHEALQARGLSPRDVNSAINRQNLIVPTGDARIGDIDYLVNANNTPDLPEEYNDFPVAVVNDSIVYLRDVAFAHDGFSPQINIVHDQGKRAVLLPVLKNGQTSIVEIIDSVKTLIPTLQSAAPKGINLKLLFDQSIFVKKAIQDLIVEALIATILTGLLMISFLRSWRSALIVLITIPLSVLTSIIFLYWMDYSLNIMTLGGLALSTGILVDNATVTIENIHRNRDLGKSLEPAILDGSYQVAIPTFISTLAMCITFLPVAILKGAPKFLFVPFAFSVVFAVFTSYLLARTLIPVLMKFLVIKEHHEGEKHSANWLERYQGWFEKGFNRFRSSYDKALQKSLQTRGLTIIVFGLFLLSALLLTPFIGIEFFPEVSGGMLRLHVRAPTGTRIEMSEEIFAKVEQEIETIIPKDEIEILTDNIGVPAVAYNLAYGDNAQVGTWDGEILIALKPTERHSSNYYKEKLRAHLKKQFPNYVFYFQPADLIDQILNFGNPTPIDVRVIGYDKENNLKIARELVEKISKVEGAVDVHLHQDVDAPELFLNVNRTLLSQQGLTQLDLSNDMLVTFSDSTVITPNYWVDHKLGIPYLIAVQAPKYRIDSIEQVMLMPLSSPQTKIRIPNSPAFTKQSELLSNLATLERRVTPAVINHYNVQPTFDIFANTQGKSLGKVANNIQKIIDEYQGKMAPGNQIQIMGLVQAMKDSYINLGIGFIFSFILIYFILVINFQSWTDPFIIIMALPGGIAGIIWILFLTHTPFSVPSLMGGIVTLGVATANSILLVAFANQQLLDNKQTIEAVHTAGVIRLRPILITSLAMIVGMIPMALAIGTAGEENAPMGRAVIGGLIAATLTTLFFVPVIFSYLRKAPNPYLAKTEETNTGKQDEQTP